VRGGGAAGVRSDADTDMGGTAARSASARGADDWAARSVAPLDNRALCAATRSTRRTFLLLESRRLGGCDAELPCGLHGQHPSPNSSSGRARKQCKHSGCAESCGESSYWRPCTPRTSKLSSAQTAWTKSNASCGSETRRALTPSAAYASTSFANLARLARSASVLPSPKIWQNVTRLGVYRKVGESDPKATGVDSPSFSKS
jgi:hypothetical protein